MKLLNNQKGTILITMLLLMVIITLIGVIAINTATVDVQISGNLRRATTAFEGAEAGVDLGISVIENTIANGTLTPSGPPPIGVITNLDTANLGTEILSGPTSDDIVSATPDLRMNNLNNVAVAVDIDYLYSYLLPGGAAQFAMGYEGVGAGAGGGGAGVLYRIDSEGTL